MRAVVVDFREPLDEPTLRVVVQALTEQIANLVENQDRLIDILKNQQRRIEQLEAQANVHLPPQQRH